MGATLGTHVSIPAQIVVLDRTGSIASAGGVTDALVARRRSYLEGELIEVGATSSLALASPYVGS